MANDVRLVPKVLFAFDADFGAHVAFRGAAGAVVGGAIEELLFAARQEKHEGV